MLRVKQITTFLISTLALWGLFWLFLAEGPDKIKHATLWTAGLMWFVGGMAISVFCPSPSLNIKEKGDQEGK